MGREGLWESSHRCEEVTEETHGQPDGCRSNDDTRSGVGEAQEQPMKTLETTDLPNAHPMKIPETAGLLLR